jgi:gamma-glutamyltranspeptidase/glutathione hydrolase
VSEAQVFSAAGVVAPHPAAAAAARDILVEGGNAIEAAVTAAAVCAVVLPSHAGLAADALWMIREPGGRGRTRVIDARGPACAAAIPTRHGDVDAETIPDLGPAAVLTVPGAPAGWHAALELSAALGGRVPVSRLLEPAAILARTGFAMPRLDLPDDRLAALAAVPGFADAFLIDGRSPDPGTTRRLPALAETLAYLAHAGLDDVYRGDVGREMAADLERSGSPLGRDDLRRMEARWRTPASLAIGRQAFEAPPTTEGHAFLLGLDLFGRLARPTLDSVAHWHGLIESRTRAAAMVSDTDADDLAPLVGSRRLIEHAEAIGHGRIVPIAPLPFADEDGAWIGVVDPKGLAATLVASMGRAFGSGVVLPGTGILMNGRASAFEPGDEAGSVLRPGRRAPFAGLPLVTTSHDGCLRIFGVTGAGAAFLAAQVVSRIDLGQAPMPAVAAPRMTAAETTDGAALAIEDGFDDGIARGLRRLGHPILAPAAECFGDGGLLLRQPGGRIAISVDPRRDGATEGF